METLVNYRMLNNDELMEIKGGFMIYSPSPLIPFITSYGAEICTRLNQACNSFIAGLLGQPEP